MNKQLIMEAINQTLEKKKLDEMTNKAIGDAIVETLDIVLPLGRSEEIQVSEADNGLHQLEEKCYLCEGPVQEEVDINGWPHVGECDDCLRICCEKCIKLCHACAYEGNGNFCLKCAPELKKVDCPYHQCYCCNNHEEMECG